MGTLMGESPGAGAVQGLEPELDGIFPHGLSLASEESSCRLSPRCKQDHEPHRFNYASTNFTHLVKPGSYRKSYFQVCCFNYRVPFINHGMQRARGLQPPALPWPRSRPWDTAWVT